MSTLKQTATDLAELCEAKRKAYGDSIPKAAALLELLYPNGIQPAQYFDALIAARQFEKQARLAQGADAHGEDPRLDNAGYALMALDYSKREVADKHPCTASGVPEKSKVSEPKSSVNTAAHNAAAKPTTSENASNARSSTQPSRSVSAPSSPSQAASALTAVAAAQNVADVLVNLDERESLIALAVRRNINSLCAGCGGTLNTPTGRSIAAPLGRAYLILYACCESPCWNYLQKGLS